MESERETEEAIRGLDGTTLDGQRITVEKARGGRDRSENQGEFVCYNCNRPGHLARDCKEKPRNPMYADTRGTKASEPGGSGYSSSRSDREGRESRYHPYGGGSSRRDRSPPPRAGPRDYDYDRRGPPDPFLPFRRDPYYPPPGYPFPPRGRSPPSDRYPRGYDRRESFPPYDRPPVDARPRGYPDPYYGRDSYPSYTRRSRSPDYHRGGNFDRDRERDPRGRSPPRSAPSSSTRGLSPTFDREGRDRYGSSSTTENYPRGRTPPEREGRDRRYPESSQGSRDYYPPPPSNSGFIPLQRPVTPEKKIASMASASGSSMK
eukprot:TRINITY_DN878_c0_g1_i2.p1 TRINITY_DN878_c0_g1~~TRINITY_DN878_c0_g1_i2.p1  ORF type:complete len:319 (+),score=16.74 TRINITY_DN878_c0_g1_i2:428-1384(+)